MNGRSANGGSVSQLRALADCRQAFAVLVAKVLMGGRLCAASSMQVKDRAAHTIPGRAGLRPR